MNETTIKQLEEYLYDLVVEDETEAKIIALYIRNFLDENNLIVVDKTESL